MNDTYVLIGKVRSLLIEAKLKDLTQIVLHTSMFSGSFFVEFTKFPFF